jgi:imidazolonepropionase-like amidohydrolase
MSLRLAAALSVLTLVLPDRARAAGEVPARDFAVKAGTVITISGEDLRPGVVVVRRGRFAAVGGPDTPIPEGLPVVDAGTQVLLPGFVEAHGQRGLDGAFELAQDASFVRVTDAINPVSLSMEDARRNGLLTVLVAPDNRGLLSGRAAVIHPQGIAVDSMIVKQDAYLKLSLQPGPGASRMGHLAELRRILDETKRYLADRKEEARKQGRREPKDPVHPTKEALVDLLEGRLPLLAYCPTAADVATLFALGREHEIRVQPVVAPEAWRAAELLAANHVTAILTPAMETWEELPDGTTRHVSLPRILHDAGVTFALTTDASDIAAQHPWHQAALAVRAGVPRGVALAAVTRVPSQLLGFGGAKGVIAPGADADFLLLSDDPLSGKAFVDEAYVKGARIYAREADDKLRRLLSRADEPPLLAAENDHDPKEMKREDPSRPHGADDGAPRPFEPEPVTQDPGLRWPAPPESPE